MGMKPISPDSAAGFILAGGHSSRMGADKALALFNGIPLVQAALQTLTEAGVSPRIAGSRSDLSAFAEEILDTFPETGPLGGIHAALSAYPADWNIFVSVDLPLMPSSLLAVLLERAMLTDAPVIATRLNGRIEPFPVVLHRSVLPHIFSRITQNETACHKAWQTIPEQLGEHLDAPHIEYLVQCGQCHHSLHLPPLLWYLSANTPSDLERLNRICAIFQPSIQRPFK
jgi:molybdopterin-guanine dinucleotide biosynthesis protein A